MAALFMLFCAAVNAAGVIHDGGNLLNVLGLACCCLILGVYLERSR